MKTKKVLARLYKLFANNGNGYLYAVLIAGCSWRLLWTSLRGKLTQDSWSFHFRMLSF